MHKQTATATTKAPPGNATTTSHDDDPPYDLEFRSSVDDAWYTARVVLEAPDTLVVKFLDFYEWNDERFSAGDFRSAEAIDEFLGKVRPLSQQLQDNQCSRVIEGMTVCASFTFVTDEIKFYDAVVEAVHYVEHSFAKEEEECLCSFLLFWQHGPNEGNVTSGSIADITLIQHFSQLHSTLASFVKMAKEKVKVTSFASGSVCDANALTFKNVKLEKEDNHLSNDRKSSLSQNGLQIKNGVRQSGSFLPTREGNSRKCHEANRQDKDLGGSNMGETGNHQFILIENLELDLSPSSIMEFIHKQTSISTEAYVFPNLLSESFTRGAIVVECKKKLKKIYDFLNNPDHIVTSSRGRPWFITEKFLRCGTFRATGSLMPISQSKFKSRSIDDELKVEQRGGKEYNRAKRLREVFMDFVEHQQGLHKSLVLEEKMILQPSGEV
ncbi:uncharacterized protein LOC131329578 isoform X2 [Rhododendron vialii]|uniref:uncharacterized protein LOC131329578 isoform X2 n=1 Tax=Rhododendron vialii TaxID=182163 RepID=UPI00265DCB30|nr:uncharacterized protein LOC131329578 isoform X2 [Rhododendron vialii]